MSEFSFGFASAPVDDALAAAPEEGGAGAAPEEGRRRRESAAADLRHVEGVVEEETFARIDAAFVEYRKAIGEWSVARWEASVEQHGRRWARLVPCELLSGTGEAVAEIAHAIAVQTPELFAFADRTARALLQEPLFHWVCSGALAESALASLPAMLERDVIVRAAAERGSVFSQIWPALCGGEELVAMMDARVASLARILEPSHLDLCLSASAKHMMLHAGDLFRGMETRESPRDKLACLVGMCRTVMAGLSGSVSADDLLPCLIYTVVQARLPRMLSELAFVHAMCRESLKRSEDGYFLVQVCSVVSFLGRLTPDTLTIDAGDAPAFAAHVQAHPPLQDDLLAWMHAADTCPAPSTTATAPTPTTPETGDVHLRIEHMQKQHATALRRQEEKHRAAVSALEADNAALRASVEQLKRQLTAQDLTGVQKQNLALRERNAELEAELKTMMANRAIDQDLMEELKQRCDLFCQQMVELEARGDRAEKETQGVQAQLERVRAELAVAEETAATQHVKYAALEAQHEDIRRELADAVLEGHAAAAKLESAEDNAQRLAEAEARLPELEAECARLAGALASEKAAHAQATEDLMQTTRTLQQVQHSFEQSRRSVSKQLAALELAYTASQSEVKTLNRRLALVSPVSTDAGDASEAGGASDAGDADAAGESGDARPGLPDAALQRRYEDMEEMVASLESELSTLRTRADCEKTALRSEVEREASLRAAAEAAVEAAEAGLARERELRAASEQAVAEMQAALAATESKAAKKVGNAQAAVKLAMQRKSDTEEDLEREQARVAELTKSVGHLVSEVSRLERVIAEKEYAELTKETWVKDADVRMCMACERSFSVIWRRHHCRLCGGVFCADCSGNRVSTASSPKPVRACDVCFQTKHSVVAGVGVARGRSQSRAMSRSQSRSISRSTSFAQ